MFISSSQKLVFSIRTAINNYMKQLTIFPFNTTVRKYNSNIISFNKNQELSQNWQSFNMLSKSVKICFTMLFCIIILCKFCNHFWILKLVILELHFFTSYWTEKFFHIIVYRSFNTTNYVLKAGLCSDNILETK